MKHGKMKFVAKDGYTLTSEEIVAVQEMMGVASPSFSKKQKEVLMGIVSRCPLYERWVQGRKSRYLSIFQIASEELFMFGDMSPDRLMTRIAFLLSGPDCQFVAYALSSAAIATYPED